MQAVRAKAVISKEIGGRRIGSNVHGASGSRDRYALCAGLVFPADDAICPEGTRRLDGACPSEPQCTFFDTFRYSSCWQPA